MTRWFSSRALLAALAVTGPAFAEDPKAPAGTPAPAAAPAPAPAAKGARIPYSEAIQTGDRAFLVKDYDGAIAAYRAEAEKSPNTPVAMYRLGEAQLVKGVTAEAEQSLQAALRFAGKDERMRSKILFLLADLKEREKAYDDAIARWKEYEQHAQTHADAKGFPATATERVKRIEAWKKISADSAEVKARIQKRFQEVNEFTRSSPAPAK